MSAVVYLVSCVSEKAGVTCAARDLYISDWFRKARAFVEATGAPWRILSALHGDVLPTQQLMTYDFTFDRKDPNDRIRRKTWGKRVAWGLAREFPGATIVIFAGAQYREFLVPELLMLGCKVETPLARLGIGQQKHWFASRIKEVA